MYRHKNLIMRAVEAKDLEKIRSLRNDPSTWMNLTDIQIIDAESQKLWFQSLARQKNSKRFFIVCAGSDRMIGLIRMDELDWVNRSVRVGCDVVKSQRGKGYGSLIMEMIVQYCFRFLNMHRLWLLVADYNKPARRVYEKSGFRTEGKQRQALYRDGKYHDYILMSLIKDEKK